MNNMFQSYVQIVEEVFPDEQEFVVEVRTKGSVGLVNVWGLTREETLNFMRWFDSDEYRTYVVRSRHPSSSFNKCFLTFERDEILGFGFLTDKKH